MREINPFRVGLHIFGGRRGVLTSENLNNLMTVHAEALDRGDSGKHSTVLFDDDEKYPGLRLPTNSSET